MAMIVEVDPESTELMDQEQEMLELMDTAHELKEDVHQAMLDRFAQIDARKQEAERRESEKNLTEAERIKKESEERERREAERLREEESRRQKEELERARRREEEALRQRLLAELKTVAGRQLDLEFVTAMSLEELRSYLEVAKEKAERERKQRTQRESEKQLFLNRALREAALPATEAFFAQRHQECVDYWTKCFDALYAQKKHQKEQAAVLRPVAEKVGAYLAPYASAVSLRRFESVKGEVETRFQEAERKRKEEEEKKRKEEEERRRREEERRRVEEERRRKEEEQRKAEEERRRREEEEERRVAAMMKEQEDKKAREREERSAKLIARANLMDSDSEDEKPVRGRRAPGGRAAPRRAPPAPVAAAAPAPAPEAPAPAPKNEEDEWTTVTAGPKRRGRKAPTHYRCLF